MKRIGWVVAVASLHMGSWGNMKKSGRYKTIPIYADPKDLSPGVPAPTKSVTKHKE